MDSDIVIANKANKLHIKDIAAKLGIQEEFLSYYGKDKAKISSTLYENIQGNENGKLILVTAINPTPAGEGKTTTTVGLGQALGKLGKKAVITLREPSLGPCMGIKGGAAGGGYSQVIPMEDINLHFTGDIHAVGSAHNLLSAMIDNHIKHGNELRIDTNKILFGRVVDMNDRALRSIVVALGSAANGVVRQDGYSITVASEVMAILCLSENLAQLKEKLGEILVAYSVDDKPVYAKDLKAEGAMAALLKQAIEPNLVQTLENTPAIMHGGPFANIAHGCNSLIATKMALKLSDYVITEAGFGADLGAEKFIDIKCRLGELKPDAVVLVATIRALKYNGGVPKNELSNENITALEEGVCNLEKHVENLRGFGLNPIVAINKFPTDTKKEIDYITNKCNEIGVPCSLSEVFEKGGDGGIDLANKVLDELKTGSKEIDYTYELSDSIKEKIKKIATKIYGADDVTYTKKALKDITRLEENGYDNLPICIAKTQYSFSDDPKKLGRPEGFSINVGEVKVSAGAGFIVVITKNIMTMPGLPKVPAATNIDIDAAGNISGLF